MIRNITMGIRSGRSPRTFMNARQVRYFPKTRRLEFLVSRITESTYKNPRSTSDLYATVRSRRQDKSPLATFYTGISIKFVRDKSCYTASGPHLKRLAFTRAKPDVTAADSSRTGHFQCCFIYCTCHTYRVVPTVGQGLIFQTGSPDTSAPVRLPRERRESHARFVALAPALVDAARWHHEILTRFVYIENTNVLSSD